MILKDKVFISFWSPLPLGLVPAPRTGEEIQKCDFSISKGNFSQMRKFPLIFLYLVMHFVRGESAELCVCKPENNFQKFRPTFHKTGRLALWFLCCVMSSRPAGYQLSGKSLLAFCLDEEVCAITSCFLRGIWAVNLRCPTFTTSTCIH